MNPLLKNDLPKPFESLQPSLLDAGEATEGFGRLLRHVKRAYWKILLVNALLTLVSVTLVTGIIGVVILGLLKLFGVI